MNPIDLLSKPGDVELTAEEEAVVTHQLAQAYWMDECAATNPDIKRLADKVRQRLASPEEIGPCGTPHRAGTR